MKALSLKPYKGTRDFYPDQMRFRKWMFETCTETLEQFGYEPYDGPLLESFDLYALKTGEEIVQNQLYHFTDRGGRKLAIRPEMTPTLARMIAARLGALARPIRWYSLPNLWRYERPQRGRLREHWQLNVDLFGGDPFLADVEILEIVQALLKAFHGTQWVEIRINHRQYVDFVFEKVLKLSKENAYALMKLMDAKAKMDASIYEKKQNEILVHSKERKIFEAFLKGSDIDKVEKTFHCEALESLKKIFQFFQERESVIQLVFDPTVVRGMDYYTGFVFEVFDQSPENNRAMLGGGRYDDLLKLFGKEPLSGVGFGMGDVTLEAFLRTHQLVPSVDQKVDVFVALQDQKWISWQRKIAYDLRKMGLQVVSALEVGKFKKHLREAHRIHSRFCVLFGEKEWEKESVLLKDMKQGVQWECHWKELAHELVQKQRSK